MIAAAGVIDSGYSFFSQCCNFSASSASTVSACFLLRPVPWPRTIPSQTTCETNVFSCSGPLYETNSYAGLCGEMLCNYYCSSPLGFMFTGFSVYSLNLALDCFHILLLLIS